MSIANNGVAQSPSRLPAGSEPSLPLTLFVDVTSVTEHDRLEEEDRNVAGLYRVELDAGAAASASLAKRVSIALDVFHHSVAIGVLDDFNIDVLEQAGGPALEDDPQHESGSESRAGTISKVGPDET